FSLTSSILSAATDVVYEAEASVNIVGGGADIASCSVCSGGKNAQNLGGPASGSIQFNAVNVTSSGSFPVTITYDNGATVPLSASVTVNGQTAQTVSFPSTGSWVKLSSVTISLPLNAGNNSIAIAGINRGWVAEIDKISVQSPTATSTAPPTS